MEIEKRNFDFRFFDFLHSVGRVGFVTVVVVQEDEFTKEICGFLRREFSSGLDNSEGSEADYRVFEVAGQEGVMVEIEGYLFGEIFLMFLKMKRSFRVNYFTK